jgi:S-DNA-T family DNA segregation ATPase FtsK/SpoIIIE
LTQKLAATRDSVRNSLGRQTDEVWGLVLVVISVLVTLAFFDLAGPAGNGFTSGSTFLFGVWRFAVPVALAGVGIALIVGKPRDGARRLVIGGITTFIGTLALFHLLTGAVAFRSSVELIQDRGGAVGSLIAFPMRRILGHWGAFVVIASAIGMGVLVMTHTSVRELFHGLADIWKRTTRMTRELFAKDAEERGAHVARPAPITEQKPRGKHQRLAEQRPPRELRQEPAEAKSEVESAPTQLTVDLSESDYQLPPLSLLDGGTGGEVNKRSLEDTARQLEDTLVQHGVDATLTKIVPGPTVTRYEIELAPGVKVNRVSNLSHDIAYALATPDVRLLVPIPGKSAIGVEVPNVKRRLVSLGDILGSPEAARPAHPLTVGLGMDISGQPKLLNLAELPHVLIAGATGAGKSSCINSIVTSLRCTHPMTFGSSWSTEAGRVGPVQRCPAPADPGHHQPEEGQRALKWAVAEMDRRYDLLADAKVQTSRDTAEAGRSGPRSDGFDRFPVSS